MATRSTIGIIDNKTGVVTSIYCHWDGYPENNGRILVEHWSDAAKIHQLMSLGALSSLGEELGEQHDFNTNSQSYCTAYGRDRGETQVGSMTHNSIDAWLEHSEEFNYLWDGQRWNCFRGSNIKKTVDLYNLKQTA